MTASLRRGWCPSLLNPMESGDGYLVRVKPRAATISSAAARAMASAASRTGSGLIDITNRCNLQFRGFRPEGVSPFAEVVFEHGLAHRDTALEQLRNVAASALGADDPSAAFDAHMAARAIEERLISEPEFTALPPKFGFSVDGGGHLPLGDVGADIVFHADGSDVVAGLAGADLRVCCAPQEIGETAGRLAGAFVAITGGLAEKCRRMRHLVEAVGADSVFLRAGLTADRRVFTESTDSSAYFGYKEYFTDKAGFFSFGLPFGQCDASVFATFSDLSDVFGDGKIRMTPWRNLVIAGVAPGDAAALARDAVAAGFIADNDDPRRRIVACPGRPACKSASVATRADATRLAASGVIDFDLVHVSGCIKGCARPRPSPVTLSGRDGTYDLVLDGRADGAPKRTGLDVDDIIAFFLDARRRASA